jgi:uncharacterized phage infection (PIP) family protein YhgE
MRKTSSKIIIFLFIVFTMIAFSISYAQEVDQAPSTDATGTSRLQEQRDFILNQRDEKRQEARDQMQQKKDEFKAKLKTVRDEAKRQIVEKIDSRIDQINKKHTDRYSRVLDHLQELIDRVDTSSYPDAISYVNDANDAIREARTSVDDQAAKIYAIEITDDAALRDAVRNTVNLFRQDIVETYNMVINARLVSRTPEILNSL